MVEYNLTPDQVKNSIERAMDLLIKYGAPYQGMVVAQVTNGPATKIYHTSPSLLVFTSLEGVERIAKGEGQSVHGSVLPWLEYFKMPRGYEKAVTLEATLRFIGVKS